MMKKAFHLLVVVFLGISGNCVLTSCEDSNDDIDTRSIDYNKTVFVFPQEGGTDSLYVKNFGYLRMTGLRLMNAAGDALVADMSFSKNETIIKDTAGVACGNVSYDGDWVKKIKIDDYTITMQYDDQNRAKNIYLIEARPSEGQRRQLILMGKAKHGTGPGVSVK